MNDRHYHSSCGEPEDEKMTHKELEEILLRSVDARRVQEHYEGILIEIRAAAQCQPHEGIIDALKRQLA
jgi:hypothetical protein